MRKLLLAAALTIVPFPAHSQQTKDECRALAEQLVAEAPGDTNRCVKPLKMRKLRECPLPKVYSAKQRPASHIVLALDASGSMAGKVGGKTKMAVAKIHAEGFLGALAKDLPVGLVVYGHKGNNKESGKEESCASYDWAHRVGASRRKIGKSIKSVKPTGWTPLAGVLDYLKTELVDLPKNRKDKDGKGNSVPVVYMVSDGKETCGGDPVAAAKALHESGVKATINVIGFDVDAETRAQLKEISDAGGGQFFPAKDANALRKQLEAAGRTERSLFDYRFCHKWNAAMIGRSYFDKEAEKARCWNREHDKMGRAAAMKLLEEYQAKNDIDKRCARTASLRISSIYAKRGVTYLDENRVHTKKRRAAERAYYDSLPNQEFWSKEKVY